MQDSMPASEYFPALQYPEQATEVKPVVAPYVPAGQRVQTVAEANAKVLAGQIPEHVKVISPVVAPKVPAGQSVQAELLEL